MTVNLHDEAQLLLMLSRSEQNSLKRTAASTLLEALQAVAARQHTEDENDLADQMEAVIVHVFEVYALASRLEISLKGGLN